MHPTELGKADLQGDMRVPGLIERSQRGLVVAPPKAGKSLLFLDLATALASMTGFLGLAYKCRVRSRSSAGKMVRG